MKPNYKIPRFREGDQWGCPRQSQHGAGWLIDWFKSNGNFEGSNIAKGKDLEWIIDNPDSVNKLQARVRTWRESLT